MAKRKLSEKEVIDKIKERIYPKYIPVADYNKFKIYIKKWEKGELKTTGRDTLFAYFGFKAECQFTYDSVNDRSKIKD